MLGPKSQCCWICCTSMAIWSPVLNCQPVAYSMPTFALRSHLPVARWALTVNLKLSWLKCRLQGLPVNPAPSGRRCRMWFTSSETFNITRHPESVGRCCLATVTVGTSCMLCHEGHDHNHVNLGWDGGHAHSLLPAQWAMDSFDHGNDRNDCSESSVVMSCLGAND